MAITHKINGKIHHQSQYYVWNSTDTITAEEDFPKLISKKEAAYYKEDDIPASDLISDAPIFIFIQRNTKRDLQVADLFFTKFHTNELSE